MDLDEALDLAKRGLLRGADLATARTMLRAGAVGDEAYTLLNIIGFAGNPADDEEIVAAYLACPDDPMLSKIALQNLSLRWGMLDKYLPCVAEFVRGVPWDDADFVRLIALPAAGFFLRKNRDSDLLSDVIRVAEEAGLTNVVRQVAVEALANALGDVAVESPVSNSEVRPGSRWFEGTLERARVRYFAEIEKD